MTRVVVVEAGLGTPSSTRLLADRLAAAVSEKLEPGLIRGVPVLPAAPAGTARHGLVLEHALRPLLSYLGAVTAPTGVFAAAEDFKASGGPRWGTGSTAQQRISCR